MRDFTKYEVWQLSYEFCLRIYRISQQFPKNEVYGFTAQIRRAALSIPTNISEGCGRASEKEFAAFLNIAIGSATETENLISIAYGLHYLEDPDHQQLDDEINLIKKKLYHLRQKLITNPA